MNIPTLVVLLASLAGPVGTLACLAFFSDLLRNIREQGGLANWQPWHVQLLTAGVSLVVPLIALAINTFVPAATLTTLEPLWAIIGTWAVAYLGQLGLFKLSKFLSARSGYNDYNVKG